MKNVISLETEGKKVKTRLTYLHSAELNVVAVENVSMNAREPLWRQLTLLLLGISIRF